MTSILTYGADPSGVADSTTALQNAITAATKAGSIGGITNPVDGVVTIPMGRFLIGNVVSGNNVTLDLSHVTLQGTYQSDTAVGSPPVYGITSSCLIFTNINVSPFSVGNGVSVLGLSIFYKNQTGASSIIIYPPTFISSPNGTINFLIESCTVINTYRMISFSGIVGRIRLRGCIIYAIDTVMSFTSFQDVLFISDCLFSRAAYESVATANSILDTYTYTNGVVLTLNGTNGRFDGLNWSNNYVFGYRFAIRLTNGVLDLSHVSSSGFDAVGTALQVDTSGAIASTIVTACTFYMYNGSPSSGVFSDTIVLAGTSTTVLQQLQFTSCTFNYCGGDFLNIAGSTSLLSITGNTFANWGKESAQGSAPFAIGINGSSIKGQISGNTFLSTDVAGVTSLGINIVSAGDILVVSNQFSYCTYAIYVAGGTKVTVIGNSTTGTGPTNSLFSNIGTALVQGTNNFS